MNKIKIAIILIATALLVVGAHIDTVRREDRSNKFYVESGEIHINAYRTDSQKYLFLPSFMDVDELVFSDALSDSDVSIMKSSKLSCVFIDTESGKLDKIYADKLYKENAKIKEFNAQGECVCNEGLKYIKGHGNYTWSSEIWNKKSFGICKKNGEKYTLVANSSDPTMIRSKIAHEFEKNLGMEYTIEGEFVDLYINGDYMGVYYLCKEFSIPKGFIIEKEFYDRYKLESLESNQGFITDAGEPFIIQYPKSNTPKENDYICSYVNEVDKAIKTDFVVADELIDMENFVNRYVCEEVTMNYDAGISSAYFYKDVTVDDKKLYYGPGWDFDMSLGNYLDWMEYGELDGKGLTLGVSCDDANEWFKNLYKYDEFRSKAIDKYATAARPYFEQLLDSGIDDYGGQLKESVAMDRIRWAAMYDKCGYIAGSDESYQELKDFIERRISFLDDEWLK